MMRYTLAALLACVLLAGCEKKPEVVVYMYSEYIDPELPKLFEQKFGVKVRMDYYENSEEALAKLQQGGGASQYDVIVISDAHVPALINQGIVRPLDMSKIPNKGNVDKKFMTAPFDPEGKYTLPYQWGTVGMMYSTEKVKDPANLSWNLMFDPAQQPGRFVLMDSMRDMLGIALKYQGHSMNTKNLDEVKQAGELLLKTKKSANSVGFIGGVGGKNSVVNGDAAMAVVYNGDAIRGIEENAKTAFAVPKEGGIIWVDVMMVPAKAPKPEAAHQFINFILDAKNGAALSNFNRYATPNAASLPHITKEDRENDAIYPSDDTVKRLEWLIDLGKDQPIYDETWTTVKAR